MYFFVEECRGCVLCVCAHASLARALRRKEATSRKYRHRVCVELLVDEPTAVSGERIGKGYQDTRAIITSSNTPSHLAPTSGAAVCCCTRQRTSLSSNDHSSSLQTSRTNRPQQYRRKKKREGNQPARRSTERPRRSCRPSQPWFRLGPVCPSTPVDRERERAPSALQVRAARRGGVQQYSERGGGTGQNFAPFFGGEIPRRPAVSITFRDAHISFDARARRARRMRDRETSRCSTFGQVPESTSLS